MTSDVKGYVVRGDYRNGACAWVCLGPSGEHLASTRLAERSLFPVLKDAIRAQADVWVIFDDVAILCVHADGREEKLPSLEEALAERDAHERVAATWRTTADGYCNTIAERDKEIERLRAQVSALMDRVERESRVVFDAERGRDEALAEIQRLQGLIGAFAKRARLRSDADGWCNLVAELAPFEALRQESVAAGTAEKGSAR